MKILLTGAGGYIGSRLLPLLVQNGHQVVALVRDPKRLQLPDALRKKVELFQANLLDTESLLHFPQDLDACYYLVHAMSEDPKLFSQLDRTAAQNFKTAIEKTKCKQIIYLSGLAKDIELSKHFSSRIEVENILRESTIAVTTLRASIIIGSGSASFQIIRDLVEKLPVMITPKWVRKKCQPIAIDDVLDYLIKVLHHNQCLGKMFEIGGPEVISYQDVLLRYAKLRNLKRLIIPVPVLSPKLSSYWLFFITKTNFYLATSLIDSLKNDSIKTDFSIDAIFPKKCLPYEKAIDLVLKMSKEKCT